MKTPLLFMKIRRLDLMIWIYMAEWQDMYV